MIKWFSAAFGAAFGVVAAAIVATAAPGDLVYVHNAPRVQITAAQAGQVANWAVSVGAWDGPVSGMRRVVVERNAGGGFSAHVQGVKTAPAASLPRDENGVRVVGVVE